MARWKVKILQFPVHIDYVTEIPEGWEPIQAMYESGQIFVLVRKLVV
jgi:hypothetical protein